MIRVLVPLPFDISDPAHGRNLRVVHLLRALQGTCAVTCVSADGEKAADAECVLPGAVHLAADGEGIGNGAELSLQVEGKLRRRALSFFSHDRRLERAVSRLAGDHDGALGFDLASLSSLLAIKQSNPGIQAVYDAIDDPWLTWASQSFGVRFSVTGLKTAVALQVIRRRLLREMDTLTAVAPRDARTLGRVAGRSVHVIPNGIDVPEWKGRAHREPLVVFTGTMHFPPNEAAAIYFVRRIWPRIRKAARRWTPGQKLRFAIVGSRPTRAVQELARHEGVEVTGYVDDVGAWLRRASVAVVPMVSGSGMKNKVLEACAAACPVVTTPLGAAGLPVGEAHGILRAETPDAFASTVVELVEDAARRERMGRAGREMVAGRFTWHAAARELCSLFSQQGGDLRRAMPETAACSSFAQAGMDSGTKEAFIHAVS